MIRNYAATLAACATLLAAFAVSAVPAAAQQPADANRPETIEVFDTLKLTVPKGWKTQPRKSRIIEHEFVAPVDDSEDAPAARITMMAAGGDVEANIDRWKGQFTGEANAKLEKLEAAGQTIHMIQLEGSFKDTMGGGPFAGGRTVVRDNYAMLGAIIEVKDGRKYFIKMTGPKEVVEAHRNDFKKMLTEMKSS